MFNIGMWLGLFFIIGLVYFLKKSSDEKKKGTKFEHKKINCRIYIKNSTI